MIIERREPLVLLGAGLVALAVSAIGAAKPGTWLLEVLPAILAVPVLVLTYKRFPLTPLAYRLILLHAVVLMIGGHCAPTRRSGTSRISAWTSTAAPCTTPTTAGPRSPTRSR